MHFSQGELMSALDFWAGRQAANIANRSSISGADKAIAEWETYSNKLRNQLEKTQLEYAKAEARRSGLAELRKHLIAELSRLDPSNPLLRAEEEERIMYAGYYEKLESLGYEVNRDGNTFRKRGQ